MTDIKIRPRKYKNSLNNKRRRKYINELVCLRGSTCFWCGAQIVWPTIDHIIPRSRGGRNTIENMELCCKDCNEAKADKEPKEFMEERIRAAHRLFTSRAFREYKRRYG